MANWLSAIGRIFRQDVHATAYAWSDRHAAYMLWDGYYNNTVYETVANGGQRDYINDTLGTAAAADLAPLYNPVQSVVDLYLHVFTGTFGKDIIVEPGARARPALIAAIDQLWQWSNMTIARQPLCRIAATQGVVGLRIVAHNHPDATRRRVYIKPEHPRVIRDVELDARGNVAQVQLEYDLTTGLAENATTIRIREEMTKDAFTFAEVRHGQVLPLSAAGAAALGVAQATIPNTLGVVPYVLLRHAHVGDVWGRNAFYQARVPIDRLNALMTHIDVQIHKHVRVKWAVFANGEPPIEIDLTDTTVAYFKTRADGGTSSMQPMVAPLDLAGAIAQAKMQLDIIQDMLPELKATQGAFLSGQSGDTIAELRKPAEDKLNLARTNYEDALIRAQQIAVSWGIVLGLWDVGTGMGTREAADRAFRAGFEDHTFNTRPLLDTSPTPAPVAS